MNTFKKILVVSLIAGAIPLVTSAAPFPSFFQFQWTPPVTPVVTTPSAPNSGVNTNTSLNWSGYVSTQGPFTGVSGTWTVPNVASASSTMADATWVGIGGVTSHSLIQAGTQAVTNRDGSVSYAAWYELLPQDMQTISLPVHAGDSISVSLTQTSAGVWQISFDDTTTGGTYETSLSYNSDESSAEWIEEMPTANVGMLPLDNFGTISFTNGSATRDGVSETIAQTSAQPMTMITQGGAALASPSSLASDGASFSITRTANPATASGGTRGFLGNGSGRWHRVGVGVGGYGRSRVNTSTSVSVTPGGPGQTITIWRGSLPPQQLLQFLQTQFGFRL